MSGKDTSASLAPIEFTPELVVLVRELISTPRTSQFYRLWAEVKAMELVFHVLTFLENQLEKCSNPEASLKPQDIEKLEGVKAFLDEHYTTHPPTHPPIDRSPV